METIKARLLTMEALGVVCCKKADDDLLPPPNKLCSSQPAPLLSLWLNQLSKIRPCEHLVSAARPSPACEAALLFHSGLLLLQKERGRFSLMRQLLFGRCELVPGEGSDSELAPAPCAELVEECGRKPKSCQALSHCRFARRSIKMSLSLSCW